MSTSYDWPASAADLLQRRPELASVGITDALDAVIGEQSVSPAILAAEARGREQQRAADVAWLYAQADVHQGEVGDQKRRGAIRHAADRRDGREPGRPEDVIGVSKP